MSVFGSREIRGLAEPIPEDANERIVSEIVESYPFSNEAFGIQAIVRTVVYVVLDLKKRGLI